MAIGSGLVVHRKSGAETPQHSQFAHKANFYYLACTPLLWVLGFHVVAGVALVVLLAARRWPVDITTNVVVISWFLVGIAQAFAITYQWSLLREDVGDLASRLVTFSILGWVLLGVGLAVGQSYQFTQRLVVRAIMVLGLHVLLLSVLTLGLIAVGFSELEFQTPLRLLLGSSPSVEFYTVARIFIQEPSFGLVLPRLVLFYPWSVALALAGIAIFLVAFCEDSKPWRLIGMAGGLCAIVFSLSRSAMVVFPVALTTYAALRLRAAAVSGALFIVGAAGIACLSMGIDPLQIASDVLEAFTEARPGSSQGRNLIYEYSWAGFVQSPLFGNGWVGHSIMAQEPLPIGSHSTLYGTLYIGGIVVFVPLVAAALLTLLALLNRALRGQKDAAVASAIMVAVIIISYGETIFSMIPPSLFIFLFMGGALAENAPEHRMRSKS